MPDLTVTPRSAGFSAGGSNMLPSMTLLNSTFYGNTAYMGAGAIFARKPFNDVSYVTIYKNTSNGHLLQGGGVECYYSGVDFSVKNSIIAGNTDESTWKYNDLSCSVTSLGNNLVGDGTGTSGLTDGVNGDKVGTAADPIDPKLGALADNGGITRTCALLRGSPAIDKGSVDHADVGGTAVDEDQRRLSRPMLTQSDIGAFELQEAYPPPTVGSTILLLTD